jgi:hypothetical protein
VAELVWFLIVCVLFLVHLSVWGTLMAKLSDVQASLDTLTASVAALAARIPAPQEPPAATEADLDGIKAGIDAATASVNALAS